MKFLKGGRRYRVYRIGAEPSMRRVVVFMFGNVTTHDVSHMLSILKLRDI